MSQQQRGRDSSSAAGYVQTVGYEGQASIVNLGPAIGASGNRFVSQSATTASTAIAVIDGTNGILWACRFNPATAGRLALIERVVIDVIPTVGPSMAQQHGVHLFRATAFTAIPTAGTALTTTSPQMKLNVTARSGVAASVPELLISVENTTSEMTAGTHTLDTLPMQTASAWQIVAGAAVPMPVVRLDFDARHSPLVLEANQGLLAGPAVTQANSLASFHRFQIWWRETDAYPI